MRKSVALVLLSALCLAQVASARYAPVTCKPPSPKCDPSPKPSPCPSPVPSPKCHPPPHKCQPPPKCHPSPKCQPDCDNLWDIIRTTPQLTYLARIIRRLGFIGPVSHMYNATIFAPTTVAIETTLKNVGLKYGALSNDQLVTILSYHIVPDVTIKQQNIAEYFGVEVETALYGKDVTFARNVDCNGTTSVVGELNSGVITKFNIKACNGVTVHLIDELLLPAFDTLVPAPPTPMPSPSPPSTLPVVPPLAPGQVAPNLMVALATNPDLSIVYELVMASPTLKTLAMSETLETTFFLPTNSAWNTPALLAAGLSVASLKANPVLLSVALSQHILGNEYVTTFSAMDMTFNALAGSPIKFDTALTVSVQSAAGNSAKIINANNGAGNSVYHIIDTVLVA